MAKRAGFFGQKPAPLALRRPYGPYYTRYGPTGLIILDTALRALLYYYTEHPVFPVFPVFPVYPVLPVFPVFPVFPCIPCFPGYSRVFPGITVYSRVFPGIPVYSLLQRAPRGR